MEAALNWLWQGAVVATAASVMLVALRGARANVRYMVCWVAAIVVVGLPAFALLRSAAAVEVAGPPHDAPLVALPAAWWTSTNVIFAVMALWATVRILELMSAVRAIRRARRRSQPFPARLESGLPNWRRVRFEGRQATLVLSDSVTRAAVLGWGRPLIAVAPSLVRTLDANDLDRVLIHEWAHVQRHDDVVSLLQIAVRVVAGWHPALWWIDRRLHVEREIACDEITVAITGSAKSYAQCLMKLSSMMDTPQFVQIAPAVFMRSGLRARVMKIVSPDRPIAAVWSRTLAAAIVLVLCALSAAVGRVTVVQATAFATPVISGITAGTPPHRFVAEPRPTLSGTAAPYVPSETMVRSAFRKPAAHRSSPSPQLEIASTARESHEVEAVFPDTSDATRPIEADPEASLATAIEGQNLPAQSSQHSPSATSPAQSAWTAAAAGGATIGRKSKDAGVATAGKFRRFARRVAGTF